MSVVQLPIFPLGQMPMPGVRLPLRIFERRYLDMIKRQLRANQGFVIAQISSGVEVGELPHIFPLAVQVDIVDWDVLPDGLLGITVLGRAPVRIEAQATLEDGLLVGQCEPCQPSSTDSSDLPAEQWDGLVAVLQELKAHPGVAELNLAPADSAAALGWQLLQLLPISHAERQKAMGLSDRARLIWLAATLDRLSRE